MCVYTYQIYGCVYTYISYIHTRAHTQPFVSPPNAATRSTTQSSPSYHALYTPQTYTPTCIYTPLVHTHTHTHIHSHLSPLPNAATRSTTQSSPSYQPQPSSQHPTNKSHTTTLYTSTTQQTRPNKHHQTSRPPQFRLLLVPNSRDMNLPGRRVRNCRVMNRAVRV